MSLTLQRATRTLDIELQGIEALKHRLDSQFESAIQLLYECQGKVVITGVGKSGLIGRKIAATFTSTGTPAVFLHSGESAHGDLGLISSKDVVLAISFSGESAEVVQMLPHIKAIGTPLLSLTGNHKSTLATNSSVHLDISVEREACPLGLAPTTSSIVTLALGDAIAMCLLEKRDFKEENFALFHPGGSLGKKLTTRVEDVMFGKDQIPIVSQKASMRELLQVLSEKQLGIVAIVEEEKLCGVFTLGDLMRLFENQQSFLDESAEKFMIRNPKVTEARTLAAVALHTMETYSITCLIVVNEKQEPIGIVQIYSILRTGIY